LTTYPALPKISRLTHNPRSETAAEKPSLAGYSVGPDGRLKGDFAEAAHCFLEISFSVLASKHLF
jgi:hypothetical protein